MTLPSTSRRAGPFAGDSDQTEFPFTFKVFAATDIAVAAVNFAGVETVLTYGADYSVDLNANQDSSPGGTVTYPISGSALPTGSSLVIYGNLPYDQPLDLPTGGNFPVIAVENEHDRTVMQIQQLKEITDRSVRVQTTSAGVDVVLPAPEAGKVLGWNDDEDALVNLDGTDLAGDLVYVDWIYETFTGTGAQTSFTLQQDPGVIANTLVSVNGLLQTPTADYTISGNTLTFGAAPALNAEIVVRYAEAVGQTTVMQTIHRVTASGGQTVFTIPGGYLAGQNALAVYVNGLRVDGAGIDYTETDSTTVTFVSGLTLGDTVVFVAGTEALGGTGSGADGAVRIVVVGDSLSATSSMPDLSWPDLLEERLNALGLRVEVINLALNSWSFYRMNNTASYDTYTVLARLVSLRPNIVIAAAGAADAIINVDARNQTQIRADAAAFFASVKASLPDCVTIYASEVMFDSELFPAAASLKNKAVAPYFHNGKSSGILAGSYCSEILDDAVASATQTRFDEWVSFDGYVQGLPDVDLVIELPYFKAARLGMTGADGLHLTAMGQRYLTGAIVEGLRGEAAVEDFLAVQGNQNYAPWNDPDYVFDAYLTASGDGYVAAAYDSQVYQLGKHNSLWNAIQPDTWYLPSKAVARISATPVPADGFSVAFWQISNARPNTQVSVSVNGAAFASSGISTDAYGNAVFPTSAGNFPAGSYTLRYKVGNEIFGPFSFTSTAATEPQAFVRAGGTTTTGGTTTYTKVAFNSVVTDNASGWSTVNNRYTAPRAGRYLVSANVALENLPDAGALMAVIYKNGSRWADGPLVFNGAGGAAIVSGGVTCGVKLAVGDYVEVYVFQYLGGGLLVIPGSATTSTWVSVDWMGF